MTVENHDSIPEQNNELEDITRSHDEAQGNMDVQGEFNISIRKLEMPVRPRGVLAE